MNGTTEAKPVMRRLLLYDSGVTRCGNHRVVTRSRAAAVLSSLFLLFMLETSAQELEPRAYWITPKASNAVYFGYSHFHGEVVFHPLLPFENVDARLNSTFLGYYRAIDFFGRSANVTLTMPYVWGTQEGLFLGEFHRVRPSGLADIQFRFSANLLGARTMTVPEFLEFREDPKTIVGASIRIEAPTGKYDPDRLINVGNNRWAFKPQVGLTQPILKRFLIEAAFGVWLFTDNDEFLVDQTWSQDPLWSGEFHFVWRFRPALWAAFDVNYFYGGRATLGEEQLPTIQGNSRLGATLSVPIRSGHSLRFAAGSGIVVRHGDNLNFFSITYQYGWISGQ